MFRIELGNLIQRVNEVDKNIETHVLLKLNF